MKRQKSANFAEKKFEDKYANNENIVKLEIIVIIHVNKEVLRI